MKNNNIAIIHREPSYYAEYQNEYSAGNYFLSYYIFHSASSRYPEEACNFFQNKFFMIYTHTFAEVLSSLFASAVCNFDNFLTLYESISFMSAVLGTTADCIFKILFLKILISRKLHDLRKIMQDAMLHILSDAFRLLKYARRFANINIYTSLNYCFGGQYFKNGGRK